ncbi:MAG: hypothetical protein GX606_01100, partial [Elusimicrobia bacterium]|nr:hypothetical protein [Elusimicrobiota bacterium]
MGRETGNAFWRLQSALFLGVGLCLSALTAWAAGLSIPSGAEFNVAGGEFHLQLDGNSGDLTNSGVLSATDGIIYLNGDWTMTGAGYYSGGNGSVYFTAATGTQTLTPGSDAADEFGTLAHHAAGTVVLTDHDLDVNGDFINTAGIFSSNSLNMSVAGDWTNTGTFSYGVDGAVYLDGTDQTIYGSTDFYDLVKEIPSATGHTLTFEALSEQTVANSLTLKGFSESDGERLLLRSSTSTNEQAYLTLASGGEQDIRYVDVENNNAENGMTLLGRDSADAGSNDNWQIGTITITWTG